MTSDNPIKAWIDEHRAIHAAATEGPWGIDGPAQAGPDDSLVVYPKNDGGAIAYVQPAWDDATAIVDAHNVTVPTALSMIEAVLELHVLNLDFDGTPYCKGCSIPYEVTTTYPCPTVRALDGVIDGG
ncbi:MULTISPECIES: hypothetical protein [unclassified Brevibacterium]|uniref:hypothetical protein n=1 Tax=unclassified Brevibacterium TaxID=2614124 RepID=UPI001E337DE7|nr:MULTISPECIES: hypothetical protein [unclassified Brevibacterium]MCD1287318.1 hypothetical protein [Brevibacterium sp. CCUG 69071]MDK8436428.1 hypothetical protein [Brevibacterium sp. H-BE7]